jgi:dTDP-4-amino-4,6-dideoxygalactose transaminase
MKVQRTLAPSAAPLEIKDLLRGLAAVFNGMRVMHNLTREFQTYFGVRHVFWLNSGKAALTLILLGLKRLSSRRKVVIPAYTCFSVPSAVVKAGLDISLCDVDPATLDFDALALRGCLDNEVLAVLPTHLLGYSVDVTKVKRYAGQHHIYVIEDVAQSFGGMAKGKPLGTMGDVAFLSFGRGKNVTCGSGGVILTNSDQIGQAIEQEYQRLEKESLAGAIRNWFEVAATQILLNPSLYWLPAGLPFLKLGETKFYRDFSIRRMDKIRAGLLSDWMRRLRQSTDTRRERASELMNHLAKVMTGLLPSQPAQGAAYLRYPILMNSGEAKSRLCALAKEEGLGISPGYPTSIQEIGELKSSLQPINVTGASILAERLVTLPTHQYVTARDMKRMRELLEKLIRDDQAVSHVASQQPSTPPSFSKRTNKRENDLDIERACNGTQKRGELPC